MSEFVREDAATLRLTEGQLLDVAVAMMADMLTLGDMLEASMRDLAFALKGRRSTNGLLRAQEVATKALDASLGKGELGALARRWGRYDDSEM